MATVDNRIVEMNFDGTKFAHGVQNTLSALDRLKNALHLQGASKGLQDVNTAAQQFNSSPMEQGAGRIGSAFSSMQAVAFGALASIGAKAVAVGSQLVNSLTLGPVMEGFHEYETNMKSIQTILANTQVSGAGLPEVNAALDELNHYSDKTIYNFSEMAKNIGTFTAAGVNLETATGSIKGIANLAALSGSTSEQASGAMYQLSQAISAGRVSLQDWNSVVNAGMGGTVFQRALAQTAVAMGKIDESAVTLSGDMQNVTISGKSFRESIDATNGPSWLTGDVLTSTLQQFTGDLTNAELAAQGFSQAQIEAIQKQAQTAVGAATEVKTLTGLMDTLKEGVTSGWSQTFRIIVGDFEEAKSLFTGISNAVGGWFGRIGDARNEMLQGWKDLGGRDVLITGLTDAFWLFAAPLAQIGQAFREIFPKSTAADLFLFTVYFTDLMAELQPAPETLGRLQRTFAGLFAILGIGWEVLKAVARFLGEIFLGFTDGDMGILKTTATLGDFLVALHEAIKTGRGLETFFDRLKSAIFLVINPIKDLGSFIGDFFENVDVSGAGAGLGRFITELLTFGSAANSSVSIFDRVQNILESFFDFVTGMASAVADFMRPVTDTISDALSNINYDQVMEGLQTGALAGIALGLKQIGGMFEGFSIFQNDMGFFDRIKEGFDNLTGTLSAMQANLKASMLLKIAAAIALLAISVVLLAGVDGPGLIRATSALTAMFVQLGAAMFVFQGIGTIASMAKLVVMGAALILIAGAILVLAAALRVISDIPTEDMVKSLIALTVMIAGIIAMSKGLDRSKGAILRSAASMILLGFAIRTLVEPVKELGSLDLGTLVKGLIGVGALLAGLALFSKFAAAGKGGLAQGAGILLLAIGIRQLADAVVIMGAMSPEELAKGLTAVGVSLGILILALNKATNNPAKMILAAISIAKIAGALGLIAVVIKQYEDIGWDTLIKGLLGTVGVLAVMTYAINKMPKVGIGQSLGLLAVAGAIYVVAEAVKTLGSLDLGSAIQGVLAVAAIMAILVVAMNQMTGTVGGAVALLIVAAALNVLLPVLTTLGSMPIPAIVIALAALAAVFAVIGLAAYFLTPVVPTIQALGIAIAILGAAVFLAGAGVFLFALGLTALAAAGAAGAAAIVAIVSGLIGLIPMVMEQIGLGLVAFANVIATSGPAILQAITAVLNALLQAVIDVTPKLVEALLTLLFNFLHTLDQAIPRIIETGIRLILALLDGVGRHIGQIVDKATTIIVNFIDAISRNLPRIVQAGINFILALMNGIGDAARNNGPALADAAMNMAEGIISGLVNGVRRLGSRFKDALLNLASQAWEGIKDFFGIGSPSKLMIWASEMNVLGLTIGVKKYGHRAVEATEGMGHDIVNTLGKTMSGLGDLVNGNVDMRPVIAPVLDLTDVRKSASGLGSLLEVQPLNLGAAYSSANSAAEGYRNNQVALEEESSSSEGEGFTFIQNNNSPKALSSAEIYRGTRSQLSIAKEALKTNAN